MSEDKPRLPKLDIPKLPQEFLDVAGTVAAMGKAFREVRLPKLFPDYLTKKYQCRKCGVALADYEVFESGWPNNIRHWCMNHIPLRSRIRLWWQERGEW